MTREYYSIPEAAALLGVSRIAVFKKVKSGKIVALRFGRNWAVPAREVEKNLAFVPPPPPPAPRPAAAPAAADIPGTDNSDAEMNSMGWD